MNAFQRFAIRVAARIAPPLRNLLETTGGRVDRLADEITMLRADRDDRRNQQRERMTELAEAYAMEGDVVWNGRTQTQAIASQPAPLKEALAELELALEDRGWARQFALADMEFSMWGIKQIMRICRLYFIKNPLVRRGVSVIAYYVFGRGVDISSEDKPTNAVIEDFIGRNSHLLGQRGLAKLQQWLHTDGNIFLAFFTDVETGEVSLRTIDPLEIEEIVTDPNDHEKQWFFRRKWMQQQFDPDRGITSPKPMEAWYCAVDHDPGRLTAINNIPIQRDAGGAIEVLHIKEGALPNWRFGCPPVYPAIDWARAYKNLMQDWASIQRALARFAWDVETKGGMPAIAALKSTLATTLANDGQQIETNPTPVAGSAFISGPGNKLTPVKTANTQTSPEEGRRILLLLCAAFGLGEHFFGDATTGSLATALSLDRPTELMMLMWQELWREIIKKIFGVVLDRARKAPGGALREAKGIHIVYREKKAVAPAAGTVAIDVVFPAVLEHDITQRVDAIVAAATLNGFEATGIDERTAMGLLLAELGVEDVESVLDIMYPMAEYKALANRTDLLKMQREQALQPPAPPGAQPVGAEGPAGAPPHPAMPRKPHPRKILGTSEAALIRATATLKEAIQKMKAA
jgi:hypothetical protein